MGALMNARGLMILIFINIGLGLGIIEQRMYSILVVVALVTTGLALPLYRRMYPESRENEDRAAASRAVASEPAAAISAGP
jgi:Kef-type K+ transport system membrane component KefB